jgi:hypothetical protein
VNGPRKLAIPREHTGRRDLDAIQRSAKKTAERVDEFPFMLGVLRSVSFTAATPKTVDHGLGTRATFILARTNYDGTGTAAKITESASTAQESLDLRSQLSVVADVNCVVDLWFYPIASEVTPR